MACMCFGSKTDDSDDEGTSSSGGKPTVGVKGPSGPGSTDWKEDEWKDKTRDIWSRDLVNLPVHMDIPRLGARMKIVGLGEEGEEKAFTEDKSRPELVKEILLNIAQAVEDPQSVENIENHYFDHIDAEGKGDIAQQLLKFFQEHVSDTCRMAKILKACHQKIVFPGFYQIKSKLYSQLPFKDLRGTWTMSIHLIKGRIEVRHRKRQVSLSKESYNPDNPAGEFDFEWELRMVFDSELQFMSNVDVLVVHINYRDDVDEERRKDVKKIIVSAFPEMLYNQTT
mmetsp:Transcript_29026/g.81203  ORF Transcript_29026/g.81203 Transcript_29026/m.81203 type:complete len:282 (+) Transcript_29026:250-1095(+)